MSKVFFIAEAGKNFIDHDWKEGVMTVPYYAERAIMLIKAAKNAGADAIKFQCHVAEDEVSFRGLQREEWIKFNESITPVSFWEELKRQCDYFGIEFMCTPMSRKAAEKIAPFVSRWKVGSGNVTDYDLLKYLAETKKPIILSTGMSTQKEVGIALYVIKDWAHDPQYPVSLLYCKSIYPTTGQAKLAAINAMKKFYECEVGYSDHTTGIVGPMNGVIWGAQIVEKHFTLDKKAIGPDHHMSLEPHELNWAVKLVRDYENIDDIVIVPTEEEIELRMKFNA